MKRRRFLQTIAAAPAVALPLVQAVPAQQPATPANPATRPVEEAAKLEYDVADAAGEMSPRFFNAQQFAALQKLSGILMPPFNGAPGALEAQAAEFLDFLIGISPVERQQLYRNGLDALNAQATKRFNKSFAEADAAQASELLAPLRQAWTYNPPTDPFARFLRAANQDVRSATINSREYSVASCMQCHSDIAVEKPTIQKLAAFAKDKREMKWVRVYVIPSYVRFSHRAHLTAGATCVECHGQVKEREQLYREGDISMASCVNCHQAKGASIDCAFCHEKMN